MRSCEEEEEKERKVDEGRESEDEGEDAKREKREGTQEELIFHLFSYYLGLSVYLSYL